MANARYGIRANVILPGLMNTPMAIEPRVATGVSREQVIADRHVEYANEVAAELRKAKLRTEVDSRNERMQAKIRDAQMKKVPYMLVVGDREAEAKAAALRVRGGGDLGSTPVAEIVERLRTQRDDKELEPGVFRA